MKLGQSTALSRHQPIGGYSDSASQLTVPKQFREDLGLGSGAPFAVLRLGDVPVLLSAIASKPGWLLTHNTKHFAKTVARQTSLRVATPAEFFRTLSALFR